MATRALADRIQFDRFLARKIHGSHGTYRKEGGLWGSNSRQLGKPFISILRPWKRTMNIAIFSEAVHLASQNHGRGTCGCMLTFCDTNPIPFKVIEQHGVSAIGTLVLQRYFPTCPELANGSWLLLGIPGLYFSRAWSLQHVSLVANGQFHNCCCFQTKTNRIPMALRFFQPLNVGGSFFDISWGGFLKGSPNFGVPLILRHTPM